MALVIADRVKVTSSTTGVGTYTLGSASTGFQDFTVIGDGNTTYYTATDGTDWEVGIGTYTASGTTLSRDTILSSSNSGSAVSWGAGDKDIFCTQPAERGVLRFFLDSEDAASPNNTIPVDALTVANAGTNVDVVLAAKGTGATLAQIPDNTTTGGNKRGSYATDWQKIRTSNTQVASGLYSTIIGGFSNTASAANSVAGGYNNTASNIGSVALGYINTASGGYSVVGGYGNTASNTSSVAIGYQNSVSNAYSVAFGRDNTVSGGYSVAIGRSNTAQINSYTTAIGYSNISSGTGSVALGYDNNATGAYSVAYGYSNTASGEAVISGGYSNTASNYYSVALGAYNTASGGYSVALGYFNTASINHSVAIGRSNTAQTNSYTTAIGYSNLSSGTGSVALGYDNNATGAYSVAGGYGNTASNTSSVAIGYQNSVSAGYSVALGAYNTASGAYSSALGYVNLADGPFSTAINASSDTRGRYCSFVVGSYPFNSSVSTTYRGDCQYTLMSLGIQTLDATQTELVAIGDANTNRFFLLDDNTAVAFTIMVVGAVTAAGDTKIWEVKGGIKRGSGAASTAIVGAVNKNIVAADSGASTWDIDVTADTTTGYLKVQVTGAASTTIRWAATIQAAEVGF